MIMEDPSKKMSYGVPWGAYWELTKPRIIFMVLVTCALGFFVGGRGIHSYTLLLATLLGTALTVGGSAVLNHYLERDVDRLMERTRNRPLPAGLVRPSTAMSYGFILVLLGECILLSFTGLLTAFLALLSAFLYVVIYTPMKRLTWLNTSLGAIPGALPPVGGWTAATGELETGAWIFFLILFAWQHPHFYAIAWMFREDYARGGFKMLPVVEADGKRTCRQVIFFSLMLLLVSVMPTLFGLAGTVYMVGAILLGIAFLAASIALAYSRSLLSARRLLRASVIYLPLLLVLSVFDAGF
ncbi:MAG: heme o synthase [Candidatus Latescibacterota bacterium]|jgi:protoheme IX farnesyltransferase|nr:heme o synthase [Candidatus Latescibacterota bacterium]